MSDIHGDMKRYRSVMAKIKLQDSDHLYILGDVIDREPDGIAILSELIKAKNVTVLLGNHEFMMLNAINGSIRYNPMGLWNNNGGMFTYQAFLAQSKEERNEILRYLSNLPLTKEITVNGTDYLLTHSMPPDQYGKVFTKHIDRTDFSVWTRITKDTPVPKGKTLVFGHTPTEYYQDKIPFCIWHGDSKIGIDCGSGHRHEVCRLACLRLNDMTEYYSD